MSCNLYSVQPRILKSMLTVTFTTMCICSSSPCNANASCTDSDNFICTCNSGFSGDGLTCQGILAIGGDGKRTLITYDNFT